MTTLNAAFESKLELECHIWYTTVYMQFGCRVNLKAKTEKDTNGFSYKLHLLTLELINNSLYHNFGDINQTLEKNSEENPYNN